MKTVKLYTREQVLKAVRQAANDLYYYRLDSDTHSYDDIEPEVMENLDKLEELEDIVSVPVGSVL